MSVRGIQVAGGSEPVHGGQVAGGSEPIHGAQYAGTDIEGPATRGIRPRGLAYAGGATPGAQYGKPSISGYGGQFGGPADASVADLIDTEGFALVLENPSGSKRLGFSPDDPAYRSIKTASWQSEVNKMAAWSATVPTTPELFGWNFADAVLAYDGDRRFHGVLLDIETSDLSDGEATLSGFGPLYWAGHGDIQVSYSGMAAWTAIEDLWLRVARATDGQIRGTVTRPGPEHITNHWIPDEGVEWGGTPSEVLQQAHGYAGMAFAADLSDPAAIYTSFVPGEELRTVPWREKSVKPAINSEGYHNQVTVIGAKRPTRPGRFKSVVTAPRREIDTVLDGEIHGRTERIFDLESEDACRARASTLLEEDRGEFTVGGSLAITPGTREVVPGYTYRVEAFDKYVPAVFAPVWATLRQVSHSYGPDEATVALSFEDESRLIEHIRRDLVPDTAPLSVKRRDSQLNSADPNYEPPLEMRYAAGAGVAGSGAAGATLDGSDIQ